MATASVFSANLIGPAIGDAFRKLDPRALIRNPVLFTTAVVALLLTVLLALGGEKLPVPFQLQLIVWLWLTVLFGTFAEALAGHDDGAVYDASWCEWGAPATAVPVMTG